MAIDAKTIIPPAEYTPWIKQLVENLNADNVGGGVKHVRRIQWAVGIYDPNDFFVRFNTGSDGHSARQLRRILDKNWNWLFMKYLLWPALLAQGQTDEEEE